MKIRIGLIGAGRMGKVFANTLAYTVSEVELAAVADADEITLKTVKDQYAIPEGYLDYRELLTIKTSMQLLSLLPQILMPKLLKMRH